MAMFDKAIFDNAVFDVGGVVVTPSSGGGAGVVIRQEPHRYSYEKYRKYKELLLAERQTVKRAKELKDKKQRRKLLAAVNQAKEAARAASTEQEQIAALAASLRLAAEAQTVAAMITKAAETRRMAQAIKARANHLEDEEIALLLLH